MVCQKVQDKLSAYMDQELTAEEQQEVEKHLAQCYLCQREWENLQFTMELVRQLPEVEAPADFRAKVMNEVKKTARPNFWRRHYKTVSWLSASAAVLLIAAVTWGVNPGTPKLPETAVQQDQTEFSVAGSQANTETNKAADQGIKNEQIQAYGVLGKPDQTRSPEEKTPVKSNKLLLARKEVADTNFASEKVAKVPAKSKLMDAPKVQPEDNTIEPAQQAPNVEMKTFIPPVQDKPNVEASRGADIRTLPEALLLKKEKVVLQVVDVQAAVQQINQLVKGVSGYIEDSTTLSPDQVKDADTNNSQPVELLIRVPLPAFTDFCANVEKVGQVQSKIMSNQDVLPDYRNLVQQVQTLETQKDQLLQKTDTGTQQDTSVTNQTNNTERISVQEQITQLDNQIQALNQELEQMQTLTGLGTLQVTLNSKNP